jgi:hypothetical protein
MGLRPVEFDGDQTCKVLPTVDGNEWRRDLKEAGDLVVTRIVDRIRPDRGHPRPSLSAAGPPTRRPEARVM